MALFSKISDIIQKKPKEIPLISIIIPVYNTTKDDIKEAFDSLLNQTIGFEKLEIIFVNDKSTKTSGVDLIKEYKNKYSNVLLFNNKQKKYDGPTRNNGLKHATGKYVMFLDDDDKYLSNACEFLYNIIEAEDVDVVNGNFIDTNTNKKVNWENQNIIHYKTKIRTIDENPNLLGISPYLCTKIYRRSFLIENNLEFEEGLKISSDKIFNFKILFKANGIIFVNEPIVIYNRDTTNGFSKSLDYSYDKLKILIKVYTYCYELFEKELPEACHILLDDVNYITKYVLNTTLDRDEFKNFVEDSHVFFKEYVSNNKTRKNHKYHKIIKHIANNDYTNAYYEYIDFRNEKLIFKTNPIEKPRKDMYSKDFDDILVSVIIPVYNGERYLNSCLNSIHDQSLKNMEIICIDDNSTDNSLNILKQHSKIDKRMRVIHIKENHGVSATRNIGIKYAKGKYLTFVDCDDWLDSMALDTATKISQENNIDIFFFNRTLYTKKESKIENKNDTIYDYLKEYEDKLIKNTNIDLSVLFKNYSSATGKLYLTSFIKNNSIRFNPRRTYCDNLFSIITFLKAKNVKITVNSYYNQRIHEKTYDACRDNTMCDNISMLKDMLNIFRQVTPLYEAYHEKFYNYMMDILRKTLYKIDSQYMLEYFKSTQEFIGECIGKYHLDKDIIHSLNKNNLLYYTYIKESIDKPDKSRITIPISIVIYARNMLEKEIFEVIHNIAEQTFEFPLLRLVFIDNNSKITDTMNIKKYSKIFPNIEYIRTNRDYDETQLYNIIPNYITTPYVMFLNPELFYVNTAIKNMFRSIRKDNMNMISGIVEKSDTIYNTLLWTKLFKTKYLDDNVNFYEDKNHMINVEYNINDKKGIINTNIPIIKSE